MMKLNPNILSGEDFHINTVDEITLIVPVKTKFKWDKEELWFRSVMLDKENNIISIGWPKFGNFDEFVKDTNILKKSLRSGKPVTFTAKEDGSLCIRFVYNGEVHFRTRGTMWGGAKENSSFRTAFEKISKEKYRITHNTIFDLIFDFGVNNTDDLKSHMIGMGVDWEVLDFISDKFEDVMLYVKKAYKMVERAQGILDDFEKKIPKHEWQYPQSKKKFAEKVKKQDKVIQSMAFNLMSCNEDKQKKIIKKIAKQYYKKEKGILE